MWCGGLCGKSVHGATIDETAVGDERQYAVVVQTVRSPAEEPRVHVVGLAPLRRAQFDVGVLDALVEPTFI